MLVLSRQAGEAVCIGDSVEVKILEVRGQGVKIGISAPRQIRIYRAELGLINARAARGWSEGDSLAALAEQLRRSRDA